MAFEEYLIGKREKGAWVAETSYGAGGVMATNGEVVGLNFELIPDFNQNWQEILSAGADVRTVESRAKGPLTLPFQIRFTPVNWKWLKYLMKVEDDGSDPYTHTFTVPNSVQSFKLEWAKRHTTNVVVTLTGCMILNAVLSFSKGTGAGEGFCVVTANCVASDYDLGATVTSLDAGNITDGPFQWRHVKLTLEGSEVVEVNNGEISIASGIEPNDSRYCNATLNRALGEGIPKTFRINGRFNVNEKDNTYQTLWDAAAAVGSTNKLEFIRGANDNMIFTFGVFKFASTNAPTDLEGVSAPDLIWTDDALTSTIATDSVDVY